MKKTRSPASAVRVDGRSLRSERSREAIVGAMTDLVGEGVLAPTAEQIAERAQVGLRSVFRHFNDLESLYAAMDAMLEARVQAEIDAGEPAGDLGRRLDGLVTRLARIFERIAPYKRAEALKRWQSAFLTERHAHFVRRLRAEARRWLPELDVSPDDVQQAVELALSFEAWDRLRSDQRLGADRARAVVRTALAALLERGTRRSLTARTTPPACTSAPSPSARPRTRSARSRRRR